MITTYSKRFRAGEGGEKLRKHETEEKERKRVVIVQYWIWRLSRLHAWSVRVFRAFVNPRLIGFLKLADIWARPKACRKSCRYLCRQLCTACNSWCTERLSDKWHNSQRPCCFHEWNLKLLHDYTKSHFSDPLRKAVELYNTYTFCLAVLKHLFFFSYIFHFFIHRNILFAQISSGFLQLVVFNFLLARWYGLVRPCVYPDLL